MASGVTVVAAGEDHSLFLKSDGSLWSMGENDCGQLGDDSTANRSTPVKVVNGGVVAADGSEQHSLYVTQDGSFWGMGYNSSGRLGDGTSDQRATPGRSFGPPRITVQPINRTLGAGDGLTFSVAGDGGSLSYQWYKDGNPITDWNGSSITPANQPVLIDPGDIFGAGATDWTNISGLIGQDFPSLAWTLTSGGTTTPCQSTPAITNPISDYVVCETGTSTVPSGVFDLTSKDAEIF